LAESWLRISEEMVSKKKIREEENKKKLREKLHEKE
jgi:hypothetical protein